MKYVTIIHNGGKVKLPIHIVDIFIAKWLKYREFITSKMEDVEEIEFKL